MEEKFEIVPVNINADIHNHTRGSDGRQSAFRFLLRASHNAKNIVSMSDHDSVKGYKNLENDLYSVVETIRADKSYEPSKIIEMLENVKILKGTELITSYNGVIIEVLGYNFDVDKMQEEIERLRTTVKRKPYEVLDESYRKIKEEGKGGVVGPFYNELMAHEENKDLLKYIDEDGEEKQADTLKLFINKHLYNKKSPLFVDMSATRPTYEDTIDAIHRAGGKAFLAHAGRYKDKMPVEEYIDDMIEKGLDGVEVFYPDHSYEFREFLLQKVREHGVKASGGSDDHHAKKEGIQYEMGKVAIPNIPETAWMQESVENGLDFIKNSEKMKEAIQQLKDLKEERKELKSEISKEDNKKQYAKEKDEEEK